MRIALVYNWPNSQCAELELIRRIAGAAGALGHECVLTDPFGNPLTPDGEIPDRDTPAADMPAAAYDFSLHTLISPNFIDAFSYCVNWNPFDFVMRHPITGADLPPNQAAWNIACFESHDALLSAGSQEMDDFVRALNLGGKQQIDTGLRLHTTLDPDDGLGFPDFADFRIFYIGANWERAANIGRHRGLLDLLDRTGRIRFYGIREQRGIFLWEGIEHYRGPLPFDGGGAILKAANRCGVSLVLHSAAHRRSGLASTRIFQACAAKTLAICDDNPFILKHFGDSVLSFEYTDDPSENCRRIMEKAEWVRRHPDRALAMARRARGIFAEKFSLGKEVAALLRQHPANARRLLGEPGPADSETGSETEVDLLYIHRSHHPPGGPERFLKAVKGQTGVIPRAVIFAPERDAGPLQKAISKQCEDLRHAVIGWKGENRDGRIISEYLQHHARSDRFALWAGTSEWFRDHLTRLLRAGPEGHPVVMSATFVKNRAFSRLAEDYTDAIRHSMGGGPPRCVTRQDIAAFGAAGFSPSAFLFHVPFFRDEALLRALRFFDKGWFFFLIVRQYLKDGSLPFFVPKATNIFIREDELWAVDAYGDAMQTEDFERSLAHAFLKNDPYFVSLREAAAEVL